MAPVEANLIPHKNIYVVLEQLPILNKPLTWGTNLMIEKAQIFLLRIKFKEMSQIQRLLILESKFLTKACISYRAGIKAKFIPLLHHLLRQLRSQCPLDRIDYLKSINAKKNKRNQKIYCHVYLSKKMRINTTTLRWRFLKDVI